MQSKHPARTWPLFLLSFVEGGSLLSVELIGAKLLSPTYGNSIYVWSAVLGTTLLGLMVGYFVGGRLSQQANVRKWLVGGVLLAGIWVVLLPILAPVMLAGLANWDFRIGILLATFLILFPPIALFGMVSPMAIQLLTRQLSEVGRSAGRIYAISTIGGLIFNFMAGLVLLPFGGISATAWITGALLLGTATLFYFFAPNLSNTIE